MKVFSLAGERPPREKLLDLFSVEKVIILESKSCEKIEPIQKANLFTYVKLSELNLGLLLNSDTTVMWDIIV